jgi:hypothetical protein
MMTPAMVKLSDDCFAHNGALMTVAEAFEPIERRLAPVVEAENVPVRARCRTGTRAGCGRENELAAACQ